MIKKTNSPTIFCAICEKQINNKEPVVMTGNFLGFGFLNINRGIVTVDDEEIRKLFKNIEDGEFHLNCFSQFFVKMQKIMELKAFI